MNDGQIWSECSLQTWGARKLVLEIYPWPWGTYLENLKLLPAEQALKRLTEDWLDWTVAACLVVRCRRSNAGVPMRDMTWNSMALVISCDLDVPSQWVFIIAWWGSVIHNGFNSGHPSMICDSHLFANHIITLLLTLTIKRHTIAAINRWSSIISLIGWFLLAIIINHYL